MSLLRTVRQWARNPVSELRFCYGGRVPIAVFMYHSVSPDADREWGPWQYAVTPDTFDRHVREMTDQYDVRPLESIIDECLDGTPPSQPTAAITFDDGYRNNLSEALPILQHHGTPATVFVASGYLDGPSPYEYRLADSLQTATELSVTVGGTTIESGLKTDSARQQAYERLRRKLKFERSDRRRAVVEQVGDSSGSTPAMLTSDELRTLADSPLVDIGAHGHEHVPLTALDERTVRADVQRVTETLEGILDGSLELFSYPYGEYSATVAKAVKRAGYRAAATTVPRRVSGTSLSASRFAIPRLDGAR